MTATKLYAAYGSNLCVSQMKARCPKAVKMGGFELPQTQLIFNRVADVVYHPTKTAMIGLWRITAACEKTLDAYEGVISKTDGKVLKRGAYRKETIKVILTEGGREVERDALIYVMNRDQRELPMLSYLNTIKEGFRDFGLDERWINEALKDTAAEAKAQRAQRQQEWKDHEARAPISSGTRPHSAHKGLTDYYSAVDRYRGMDDRLDDLFYDDGFNAATPNEANEEVIERMRLEAENEFNEFDEETYTYVGRRMQREERQLKEALRKHDKSGYKLPAKRGDTPHLFDDPTRYRKHARR